MRNHKRRRLPFPKDILKLYLQHLPHLEIHRTQRLIHQKNLRVTGKRAQKRDSLFHSSWAFVPSASGLLVFGRQFVVWVVLMVSPTPGGSGISEWLFANYYGDLIGDLGVAAVLALVWRLFSYYIYLIAGVSLLPGYFGKNARKPV